MKIHHVILYHLLLCSVIFYTRCHTLSEKNRQVESFCKDWKFYLGDIDASHPKLDDSEWRSLNLPHDWSIEGDFSPDHPATPGGGSLPGGIGWYRKTFYLPDSTEDQCVYIDFDGIYMNSEVWINGYFLGKRPNGYISFRYELTPYLKYGNDKNVIAVRVDNSHQPNSRWYTGSGIYRNVWLVAVHPVHVDHWGTFVTTPEVDEKHASVRVRTTIRNASHNDQSVNLETTLYNSSHDIVVSTASDSIVPESGFIEITHELSVSKPNLWSIDNPYLYTMVTEITSDHTILDRYETSFGIRSYYFDADKGFFLNQKPIKIKGVCNHHDLGCFGAAINVRALERQLEIMKDMGVNSIRTSHNPPAPELLDLCDRMGFIVMDEMFDMWKKRKTPYDFSLYWDEWHEQDLRDFIRRDRNHPSVMIWSIGNEILEQWDSTGTSMARELAGIVREQDSTRLITSGCNDPRSSNAIVKSGVLDLIGFNYHHKDFESFPLNFPGQKFIATETNSGLATRGHYDMPSDSIRRWPVRWDRPFTEGNADHTCSAYDNCCTPWGSTQEETWKIVRKYNFLSGIYIWTGFDYLGEPTPYGWPSRSSYFGIVDLAGFPKDTYYFYKSEWTDDPVLHVFPHWNWEIGDTVDVWAYTNCEEAELFLNGESQGTQKKTDDCLHLMWRVAYQPGTLKCVGHSGGKHRLKTEVKTAGPPSKIILLPDRKVIAADGRDLSFIKVQIEDRNGNFVPTADNQIHFEISGEGKIVGVDNGLQTSHESFRASDRKAFNGLCLVVVQSIEKAGKIRLKAFSEGLEGATAIIRSR